MAPNIGAKEAIKNAQEFLEEFHGSFNLISTTLEGKTWLVICDVGFLNEEIKEVKVDADSGKILGYVNVSED